MMTSLKIVLFLCSVFIFVNGDTPANCTYEDIQGIWQFNEGERSGNNEIDCTTFAGPSVYNKKIELIFPDIAVDELGNRGFWTLIYNQGFEVVINYRKYFAFSAYKSSGSNVTSFCDKIQPGWSHDVLGKNWACYNAKKVNAVAPKLHYEKERHANILRQSHDFAKVINSVQNSWEAVAYPELSKMTMEDFVRRAGGLKSRIHRSPGVNSHLPLFRRNMLKNIPEEFDWRNVNGVNFVSPIRNQGSCGSCYSFSSMGMLESRLRVKTNNTVKVTFAPQDVVSCSEYAQGCEGGFPYLIAGKYAQDFGVVPEECNPYTGKDDKCNEKQCKRYYVAKYKYIGGFYGGCNEEVMKEELVENGPIAVSFEVYPDFALYKGGIYHYTGVGSGFNPFHITNHAVLAVGYGADKTTGEKFWIVKNSWGEQWGEKGYFRIRRGTDECSIESIAVAAEIIP